MFRSRVTSRLLWRPVPTVPNRETAFLAVFSILFLNVCNVETTGPLKPHIHSRSVVEIESDVCDKANAQRRRRIITCTPAFPSTPQTASECQDAENALNEVTENILDLSNSITNAPTLQEKTTQVENVLDYMLFVVDKILLEDKQKDSPSKTKEHHMGQVLQTVEGLTPVFAGTIRVGERQEKMEGNVRLVLANVDLTNNDLVDIGHDTSNDVHFWPQPPSGQKTVALAVLVIAGDVGSGINKEVVKAQNISAEASLKRVLNTDIVVLSPVNVTQLKKNVTITFQLLFSEGFENPLCVSLAANPGAKLQSKGCTTQMVTSAHITCSCNHLTSFAVIMSVTEEGRAQQAEDLVQDMLSTVCLILSLVCLFLSFVTFVSLPGLESERNIIHRNLTACLFLAQLLFLVGIDQTDDETVCAVIAGLLHFLLLATFMWMLNEGICLYIKLVIVFEITFSIMPVMYALGYGIPVVIVVVSAIIFPEGYGTEMVCWLSLENGFIYSFVGPVILVAVFDFAMLCVAVRVMVKHGAVMFSEQRDMYMRWAKGSFALLSTFGITWVFGIFALGGSGTAVFAYIFIILNGSQGVFIFVFHCLLGEKVKKEYRRVIRSMTWLPDPIQRCLVACLGVSGDLSRMHIARKGTSTSGIRKGTVSQFLPTTAHETQAETLVSMLFQPAKLEEVPSTEEFDALYFVESAFDISEPPPQRLISNVDFEDAVYFAESAINMVDPSPVNLEERPLKKLTSNVDFGDAVNFVKSSINMVDPSPVKLEEQPLRKLDSNVDFGDAVNFVESYIKMVAPSPVELEDWEEAVYFVESAINIVDHSPGQTGKSGI